MTIDFHLDDFFNSAKEYLKKAADTAKEKLDMAKQKVLESKVALTNARSKMQGWKNKLDEYKNWLQKKSDEIEESKTKMRNDCKQECGQGKLKFYEFNLLPCFLINEIFFTCLLPFNVLNHSSFYVSLTDYSLLQDLFLPLFINCI